MTADTHMFNNVVSSSVSSLSSHHLCMLHDNLVPRNLSQESLGTRLATRYIGLL